jgi:hypothetical protein
MLAVFLAILRRLPAATLADLRARFVDLGDSPAGITAIDRELNRRASRPPAGHFRQSVDAFIPTRTADRAAIFGATQNQFDSGRYCQW